jgi:hypothetical protein
MGEPRQPGKLEMLLALVSTGVMAWYMMPPQERYWVKLTVLQKLHRLSGRLAYREGHRGMGDELAGRDYQRYGLAYRLSQARDALGRALEDMRP